MSSEAFFDLQFDSNSIKSGKRPIRPKLLKLTDVAIPQRIRKKNKVKVSKAQFTENLITK